MLNRNHIIQSRFRLHFTSLTLLVIASLLPIAQAKDTLLSNVNFEQPAISIIIDDMGYRLQSGLRAVNLPGAITYSFLPHSPHAVALSQSAYQKNKEIMLHLPMESEAGKKLGPGGLTECMTEDKFTEVLQSSLNSVPHVSGFNNHMGSLLTKSQLWMTRLMRKAAMGNKLYFVDSRTTSNSVAYKMARNAGIESIKRDIFIDHEDSKDFIQKQLKKLIVKAQRNGTALAIAHPKKMTLSILEQWLPELESKGIQLIPVSDLIALKQQRRLALWKAP